MKKYLQSIMDKYPQLRQIEGYTYDRLCGNEWNDGSAERTSQSQYLALLNVKKQWTQYAKQRIGRKE